MRMKKILSLVALLLTSVVGMNAQTTLYSWESPDGTPVETGGTIVYTNGEGDRLNYKNVVGDVTYYTICLNGKKGNINDAAASANAGHMVLTLDEALQEGDEINITAYINKTSSSKASAYILIGSTGVEGTVYGDEANVGLNPAGSITTTTAKVPAAAAGSKTVKLSRSTASTNLFITKLTITRPDANAPALSVDTKTLSLPLAPAIPSQSGKFTLTGENLTDGTYSLTVPNLAGLTVTPAEFTVTGGAVAQEFTVTFASESDVEETTATITAATDGVSASVEVTCSAVTTSYTLTSVSEATTWDFTQFANEVDLTKTTPKHNTETILYANLNGIVAFNENFSLDLAKTVAFEGQYPARGGYAQNGTVKFTTTVPGTVEVEFSNTGGSNKDRYVQVTDANGVQKGEVEADGTTRRTESFDVAAGEVAITGVSGADAAAALRFFIITFTPKAEEPATEATITVPETITDGKFYYTTFSSDKALDFSDVEGIEAYTGVKTGNGAYLTLTQVEQIPANTGVVIKAAEAKDYTIPFAEGDVEAPEANDLIAAVETVSSSTVTNVYLINDYMDTWEGSALVFRSIGSAADIPAGTAYLSLTSAEEDEAYGFVFCKFPIAPGEVVMAANIGELKALTEAATVELTLTNAQVTFSKYDSENGVDAFVLSDASGAIVIKNSEVTMYLTEGSVLNGKVTIELQVADYSLLGGGIAKAYSLDMTSAMDLAYATMDMGTNVTVTEGTAEPIEVTEDNFTDYILSGYDWRFVKFANAVFNASENTFSFLDGGLETQISDDFKAIVDESMFTDGAVFEVTGFINDYPLASDPVFTPVTVTPLASTLTVTVGTDGYATFCSDKALDFTEAASIKAYTATLSGTDITFTRIYNVPANTGVLLWAEGGASEEIAVVDGGGVTGIQNVLKGTMEDMAAGSLTGKYILAKNGENIGFYKAGASATLAAGKAYIEAPAAARIILPGGETTGINGVEAAEADAAVYNLQGQRIQKAQKGLNIKNGRKYIVR